MFETNQNSVEMELRSGRASPSTLSSPLTCESSVGDVKHESRLRFLLLLTDSGRRSLLHTVPVLQLGRLLHLHSILLLLLLCRQNEIEQIKMGPKRERREAETLTNINQGTEPTVCSYCSSLIDKGQNKSRWTSYLSFPPRQEWCPSLRSSLLSYLLLQIHEEKVGETLANKCNRNGTMGKPVLSHIIL